MDTPPGHLGGPLLTGAPRIPAPSADDPTEQTRGDGDRQSDRDRSQPRWPTECHHYHHCSRTEAPKGCSGLGRHAVDRSQRPWQASWSSRTDLASDAAARCLMPPSCWSWPARSGYRSAAAPAAASTWSVPTAPIPTTDGFPWCWSPSRPPRTWRDRDRPSWSTRPRIQPRSWRPSTTCCNPRATRPSHSPLATTPTSGGGVGKAWKGSLTGHQASRRPAQPA